MQKGFMYIMWNMYACWLKGKLIIKMKLLINIIIPFILSTGWSKIGLYSKIFINHNYLQIYENEIFHWVVEAGPGPHASNLVFIGEGKGNRLIQNVY